MHSVEMVVAHIKALSADPDELLFLHSLLREWEDSLDTQEAVLRTHLEQLDPADHSLGYLYLMEACSSGQFSNEHDSGFLQSVVHFIKVCSQEQIRLAPDKFLSLCKYVNKEVTQLEVPEQGIWALRTAIRKLQPSPEHLTPLHSDFLLLCISAECYNAALTILDDDIFEFDKPEDLFFYCYYGGMVNIELERFQKALELLQIVVTAPMTSFTELVPFLHKLTVAAQNKYILVSLIHNGQLPMLNEDVTPELGDEHSTEDIESEPDPGVASRSNAPVLSYDEESIPPPIVTTEGDVMLSSGLDELQNFNLVPSSPKYTSSASQGNLKTYVQPYIDLATSYATGTMSVLEACIHTNLETFKSDKNCELVKLVKSSLFKRSIQRLAQTYLTLSLHDLALTMQLKGPNEAEMHVLHMIQDGELFATINKKDGTVNFHEDPEQYKSCEMINHIDASIQRVMSLSEKLRSIDDRMSYELSDLAKAGKESFATMVDNFGDLWLLPAIVKDLSALKEDLRSDIDKLRSQVEELKLSLQEQKVDSGNGILTPLELDVETEKKLTLHGFVQIDKAKLTLNGLVQHYINLREPEKNGKVKDVLGALEFNHVVIFVKSPSQAAELNKFLLENNFPSIYIHSKMSVEERLTVYRVSKDGPKWILVAKDLVGRGIDERVNIVINYDTPNSADTYLRKVGRAGPGATKGLAITFVTSDSGFDILDQVQSRFGVEIEKFPDQVESSTYM